MELSAARSGIFSCAKTWEAIRSKLPVDGGWFGIHLIYQDILLSAGYLSEID